MQATWIKPKLHNSWTWVQFSLPSLHAGEALPLMSSCDASDTNKTLTKEYLITSRASCINFVNLSLLLIENASMYFCAYYYFDKYFKISFKLCCSCAPVTQRARVRSPVGTSFLSEVFRGFSSPVRQMSGSFRFPRSHHPSSFITGANDLRIWRALKSQIYIYKYTCCSYQGVRVFM